jgi:hypothetical protein
LPSLGLESSKKFDGGSLSNRIGLYAYSSCSGEFPTQTAGISLLIQRIFDK